MPEPALLAVEQLSVTFRTEAGPVRAVDGVSFAVGEREIVSIVGEFGSGKTVTAMSILGLLGEVNVAVTGSIRLRGRELVGLPQRELRALRGGDVAMIFQDPMTALTPVYTIGWQIEEQLRDPPAPFCQGCAPEGDRARGGGRHRRPEAAPSTATRTSSPAACGSGR